MQKAAEELGIEVDAAIAKCGGKAKYEGGMKDRMRDRMEFSLSELNRHYNVDEDILKLFDTLFEHM